MIKRKIKMEKVQIYSNLPDYDGEMEFKVWLSMFTLKHNILTAGQQWVKTTKKDGETFYYSEFFGKHYNIAKKEDIGGEICYHETVINNAPSYCRACGFECDKNSCPYDEEV